MGMSKILSLHDLFEQDPCEATVEGDIHLFDTLGHLLTELKHEAWRVLDGYCFGTLCDAKAEAGYSNVDVAELQLGLHIAVALGFVVEITDFPPAFDVDPRGVFKLTEDGEEWLLRFPAALDLRWRETFGGPQYPWQREKGSP